MSVALWLSQAGMLEDAGVPVFRRVWAASLVLMVVQAAILAAIATAGRAGDESCNSGRLSGVRKWERGKGSVSDNLAKRDM